MTTESLTKSKKFIGIHALILLQGALFFGCKPIGEDADSGSEANRMGILWRPPEGRNHPLTGPRADFPRDWKGTHKLKKDKKIVVMPGHADAQCPEVGGSGTAGRVVGTGGGNPMKSGMTDELYWALQVSAAVAKLGKTKGLNIQFYDTTQANNGAPGFNPRCIVNPDVPPDLSTWSKGNIHRKEGGYAFEIHFDAYGSAGIGSGLIPQLLKARTTYDESLAIEFGAYPLRFRGGLGGPRRGVSLLEIGKLEGALEAGLRNPQKRSATIQAIAERIVGALKRAHIALD